MITLKTKEAFNTFTNTIFQSLKDGNGLNQARNELAKRLGFGSAKALYSSLEQTSKKISYSDEIYNDLEKLFPQKEADYSQIDGVYINIYEQIGTFYSESMGDSKLILASIIEFDEGKAWLRQFLTTIDAEEEGCFHDVEFKGFEYEAPKNFSLSVDLEDIPNKGLMVTMAGMKIAQEHRSKIESILGHKFDFEYDPYRATYIFNGVMEEKA